MCSTHVDHYSLLDWLIDACAVLIDHYVCFTWLIDTCAVLIDHMCAIRNDVISYILTYVLSLSGQPIRNSDIWWYLNFDLFETVAPKAVRCLNCGGDLSKTTNHSTCLIYSPLLLRIQGGTGLWGAQRHRSLQCGMPGWSLCAPCWERVMYRKTSTLSI